MNRLVHTKAQFSTKTTDNIKKKLVDMLSSGDIELVNQNGVLTAFAETEYAEDEMLKLHAEDNCTIVNNFPTRYKDDGSQAIPITPENIKELGTKDLLKSVPEKYSSKVDSESGFVVKK